MGGQDLCDEAQRRCVMSVCKHRKPPAYAHDRPTPPGPETLPLPQNIPVGTGLPRAGLGGAAAADHAAMAPPGAADGPAEVEA